MNPDAPTLEPPPRALARPRGPRSPPGSPCRGFRHASEASATRRKLQQRVGSLEHPRRRLGSARRKLRHSCRKRFPTRRKLCTPRRKPSPYASEASAGCLPEKTPHPEPPPTARPDAAAAPLALPGPGDAVTAPLACLVLATPRQRPWPSLPGSGLKSAACRAVAAVRA